MRLYYVLSLRQQIDLIDLRILVYSAKLSDKLWSDMVLLVVVLVGSKYLSIINLTKFYAGFVFIFKAYQQAHSELCNYLCSAENEKKDNKMLN